MNFKRFVILALALCMALCLCACGGDSSNAANNTTAATEAEKTGSNPVTLPTEEPTEPDTKVEYTIKVVDFEGNPVEGVKVQMCIGELCKTPIATDAQGIVTVKYEEDIYEVKVSNIPENMQAPAVPSKLYEGEHELTIELQRKVLEYVVHVTDEGGNPVSLVKVQFQNTELSEIKTDDKGEAKVNGFDIISGIKLTEIPEGYTADATEYAFEAGAYELTVVLKAVA